MSQEIGAKLYQAQEPTDHDHHSGHDHGQSPEDQEPAGSNAEAPKDADFEEKDKSDT